MQEIHMDLSSHDKEVKTKKIIVGKSVYVLPLLLGAALVIASIIGAYTWYSIRTLDNVVVVTGSAKKQVTSDRIDWTLKVSRTVTRSGIKTGYRDIASDLAAVKQFLTVRGIPETAITISPVTSYESYTNNGSAKEYVIEQIVEVASDAVDKITDIAKETTNLTDQGILASTVSLNYYYSALADLRVSLLSDAIKDARNRATEVAKESSRSVGKLRSASSGVVQVLSANSTDISDYGSYDTSKKEKDVMVTVKATFSLK